VPAIAAIRGMIPGARAMAGGRISTETTNTSATDRTETSVSSVRNFLKSNFAGSNVERFDQRTHLVVGIEGIDQDERSAREQIAGLGALAQRRNKRKGAAKKRKRSHAARLTGKN